MAEQFKNEPAGGHQSTLVNAILANAVSLEVASAAKFSTIGTFRILVGDDEDDPDAELYIVTAVAGTVFTVTPGAEGTTSVAHPAGSKVYQVLTVAGLLAATVGSSSDTEVLFNNAGVVGGSSQFTWSDDDPDYPVLAIGAHTGLPQNFISAMEPSYPANQQGLLFYGTSDGATRPGLSFGGFGPSFTDPTTGAILLTGGHAPFWDGIGLDAGELLLRIANDGTSAALAITIPVDSTDFVGPGYVGINTVSPVGPLHVVNPINGNAPATAILTAAVVATIEGRTDQVADLLQLKLTGGSPLLTVAPSGAIAAMAAGNAMVSIAFVGTLNGPDYYNVFDIVPLVEVGVAGGEIQAIFIETTNIGAGASLVNNQSIYIDDQSGVVVSGVSQAINYADKFIVNATGGIKATLPTSAAGLSAGDFWNNSGVVNVV